MRIKSARYGPLHYFYFDLYCILGFSSPLALCPLSLHLCVSLSLCLSLSLVSPYRFAYRQVLQSVALEDSHAPVSRRSRSTLYLSLSYFASLVVASSWLTLFPLTIRAALPRRDSPRTLMSKRPLPSPTVPFLPRRRPCRRRRCPRKIQLFMSLTLRATPRTIPRNHRYLSFY